MLSTRRTANGGIPLLYTKKAGDAQEISEAKKTQIEILQFYWVYWLVLILAVALFARLVPIRHTRSYVIVTLAMFILYGLFILSHYVAQTIFAHLEYLRQNKKYQHVQDLIRRESEGEALSPVQRANIFRPSVCLSIPIYNEKTDIAYKCIESCVNQKGLPIRIIAVDDGSRNYNELNRRVYSHFSDVENISFYHQENQGKRFAQKTAFDIDNGQADLIVTIDSDTILYDPYTVLRLVQPFREERVGAVTGNMQVINTKQNRDLVPDVELEVTPLSNMIGVRYWAGFHQERASQSYFGCVNTCSGPLSAYRNEVIQTVKEDYISSKFFGSPRTFGDDRSLTTYTLGFDQGKYDVEFNQFAACYTESPTDLKGFERQQLRWHRAYYMEFFRSCRVAIHKNIHYIYELTVNLFAPLWLMTAVVNMLYLTFADRDLVFLLWYLLLVSVMAIPRYLYSIYRVHAKRFFWLFGYAYVHIIVQMPLRILAFFTTRSSKWGTRGIDKA